MTGSPLTIARTLSGIPLMFSANSQVLAHTLSQDTARLMVFKLVMAASKTWRRLKAENQLLEVIQGVTFRDGVEVIETPTHNAA
jgi:hypothetical protein